MLRLNRMICSARVPTRDSSLFPCLPHLENAPSRKRGWGHPRYNAPLKAWCGNLAAQPAFAARPTTYGFLDDDRKKPQKASAGLRR
jgi:hypothetical protein